MKDVESIVDLIGNTPLLPLRRLVEPGMARVLVKMESFNPSGSLKDRIVKFILEQAAADGSLRPEHIITDASSGNTGIALARSASVMGYRSRIYMPETKSLERRKIMRALGTELVLTTGEDQNSHIWAAQEAAKDTDRFFYLDQNGNRGNTLSHYQGTGREIVEQTDGRLDAFVAGAGTGGTLMGMAEYLRDEGIGARIVGVEPATALSHIEGLLHFDGSFVPPIWQADLVDEMVRVEDETAYAMTRRLAIEEGLFCGVSTGAMVSVALEEARRLGEGKTVVTIAGDRGDRYLSTGVFDQ